jgi:hypothetical protein
MRQDYINKKNDVINRFSEIESEKEDNEDNDEEEEDDEEKEISFNLE